MLAAALALLIPVQPIAGRPSNYIGAIGEFRLESAIHPTSGDSSTAFVLSLRLLGKGDVGGASIPDLSKQKAFDARFVVAGPPSKDAVLGGVEFRFPVRVRSVNVDSVPPISVAVWNPSPPRPHYETLVAPRAPIVMRKPPPLQASEFQREEAAPRTGFYDSRMLIGVVAMCVFVAVVSLAARFLRRKPRVGKAPELESDRAVVVEKEPRSIDDARDRLVHVFGLSPGMRTTADILHAALLAKVEETTAASLLGLLKEQDRNRFSGRPSESFDVESRLEELARRLANRLPCRNQFVDGTSVV